MYASNRYDKEFVRIPQNYAGNAFSMPPAKVSAEKEPTADASELPSVQADTKFAQALQDATREEENESVPVSQPTEVAQAAVQQSDSLPGESREGAWEWLTRLGIGQEELLLIGLLLLMRGEQSQDVTWLLLLLLALR